MAMKKAIRSIIHPYNRNPHKANVNEFTVCRALAWHFHDVGVVACKLQLSVCVLTHSWNRPMHGRAVPSIDRVVPQIVPPFMDP